MARIAVAVLLSSGSVAAFGPAVRTQATPRRPAELPLVITAVRIDTGDPIPAGYGMPKLDVRNDGKLKIIACGVSFDAIFAEVTAHEPDPTAAFVLIRARMESERDPTFKTGGGPWYDEIGARMTEHRMTLVQTTPERVLENLRTTIAEQKALSDTHLQRRR